jgi:hypothetical protein
MRRRIGGYLMEGVLLSALFALSLGLNTANNDFPPRYHPDEKIKVRQLISHQFNFYHPQLLLTATRGVGELVGPSQATLDAAGGFRQMSATYGQTILRNGRWVSAAFAALAACALALAVRLHYGRLAGAAAGLMVVLNHGLIARGHYMKEDTALLLGIGVLMLGLAWAWRRRGGAAWAAAATVGLGAGLATAGKYVGIAPAVAAIALLIAGPFMSGWRQRVGGGGVALVLGFAVFCGANFEGVFPFTPMQRGFDREWNHVTSEHSDLVSDGYGRYATDVALRETTWPALVGVGGFIVWLAWRRRRPTAIDLSLLLFPPAYALLITRSAVQFDRYFLPTVVFLQAAGGVGLVMLGREVLRWWAARREKPAASPPAASPRSQLILAGVVLLALLPGVRLSWSCVQQFGDDSRDRLAVWLQEHFDERSRVCYIVADEYAKVDERALRNAGHRVRSFWPAFRYHSLEEMRERGVTHVIVCNLNYDRFLHEYRNAGPGDEARIARITESYRRLFDEGRVLWQSRPRIEMPYYVNPAVTVFELPADQTARR